MKGQTQPVVLMLTATVLVGSIATVYVWGEPLLQKGQSQADLQNIERDAINLQSKITRVSRSGEGASETIGVGDTISTSEGFEISINEEKNYIDITTASSDPPYPIGTWTLIKGKSLQNLTIGEGSYGIKGEDLPGTVAVKPRGTSENTLVTYRVDFRNMYTQTPTGERLERVDIVSEGRSRTADSATLGITNSGSEWDRNDEKVTISGGKKLERKNKLIKIDIR